MGRYGQQVFDLLLQPREDVDLVDHRPAVQLLDRRLAFPQFLLQQLLVVIRGGRGRAIRLWHRRRGRGLAVVVLYELPQQLRVGLF